jgi:hypothetical protein
MNNSMVWDLPKVRLSPNLNLRFQFELGAMNLSLPTPLESLLCHPGPGQTYLKAPSGLDCGTNLRSGFLGSWRRSGSRDSGEQIDPCRPVLKIEGDITLFLELLKFLEEELHEFVVQRNLVYQLLGYTKIRRMNIGKPFSNDPEDLGSSTPYRGIS